ncbi:hypothetical protein HYC85_001486 [Camellia sinensis]|uniref:VAN3-binding protein-like auxin canalisation domain-containing protein n=1 Tax=Camellia sinensis TaxID=4442 RepID=A0A7J7I6T7_CAMSI|nr:hypothetical protein HYC85_001486 [Camellia sinensis]
MELLEALMDKMSLHILELISDHCPLLMKEDDRDWGPKASVKDLPFSVDDIIMNVKPNKMSISKKECHVAVPGCFKDPRSCHGVLVSIMDLVRLRLSADIFIKREKLNLIFALVVQNLFLPLNACDRIEEHEEGNAEEETLEKQMDFNHMKGSLKLKPLTQIFRSRSKKKKDEFRLHTAKLHAALSLTQLAAAIAGFATSGTSTEAQQDHIEHITSSRASTLALWDQDAGVVVASAAALLTTVWAEAAESLGAKRAHVASAVKSGLATQTPVDMVDMFMGLTLVITGLKGAATLKSRAKAGTDLPRNQELLRVGAQISIVMPSGE